MKSEQFLAKVYFFIFETWKTLEIQRETINEKAQQIKKRQHKGGETDDLKSKSKTHRLNRSPL